MEAPLKNGNFWDLVAFSVGCEVGGGENTYRLRSMFSEIKNKAFLIAGAAPH